MENRLKTFSDKSLEIIKKNSKKDDNDEAYNFLNFAINLQAIQKYNSLSQFKSKYVSAIENQLQKKLKRKSKK